MMLSSSYESLQAKIAACEEIDDGIRTGLGLQTDSHSVEGIEYISYCFLSRSCLILCYLVQQYRSIIEKYEPTSHLVFLDGQFQAVEHSATELVIKKADEIHGVNIACNKENCEDTDHFHPGDGIPWLASVRELEGKMPVASFSMLTFRDFLLITPAHTAAGK